MQMVNATDVGAFLGLGIFGLGVLGLEHMQARVVGGWNRIKVIPDLSRKYRALINEGKAPLWPLVLYRVCFPLGIVVAFASIFFTKSLP
jgi:hypothetical protein